jgi:hypothetical protein
MKVRLRKDIWQIDSIPNEVALLHETLQGQPDNQMLPIVYSRSSSLIPEWWGVQRRWLRNYLFPWLLVIAWIITGFFAGRETGQPYCIMISSLAVFVFLGVSLRWHHLKKHGYLFYFYDDHGPVEELKLKTLLDRIISEKKKTLPLCRRWSVWFFEKFSMKVYVRSFQPVGTVSGVSINKICQILSAAFHFNQIIYSQETNDKYYLAKIIFNQRLPEIFVAICSLWALSFGFYQTFGAVAAWTLLVLTLCWLVTRTVILLRSLRIWAPLLPDLKFHPAFQNMEIVSPDPEELWKEKSLDVISHNTTVIGWIIQAVIGLYLLLFVQMMMWDKIGKFWH